MRAALLAMGLAALSSCGRPDRGPAPASLPTVTVWVVRPEKERHGALVPATLQPVRRATVSTRVPARVRSVRAREGEAVEAGQVLVSLADDDLRSQRVAALAELQRAAAHARRIGALVAEGAATASEHEGAQADLARAAAAVGAAEEALRYTEVRAPFAGRIQAKRVTEGDLVTPGAPLLDLEGGGLELVATLSGGELALVSLGQRLPFLVAGARGTAEVSAIAPSADPVAHRVEIRARVVSAPTGVRGGLFARLQLPAEAEAPPELWVPTSALVQKGDLRGAFVAREGRAELRWLLLGDASGPAVPVRAGLDGTELVIDAPGSLQDGQPIQVSHGP